MDKEFERRVREELIPKIKNSNAFISICPVGNKVDIKFALELGLAIMLEKPILAVVSPGTVIPKKLRMIADRVIELDITDPDERERLAEEIKDFANDLK